MPGFSRTWFHETGFWSGNRRRFSSVASARERNVTIRSIRVECRLPLWLCGIDANSPVFATMLTSMVSDGARENAQE
jgi:hypothetical protein